MKGTGDEAKQERAIREMWNQRKGEEIKVRLGVWRERGNIRGKGLYRRGGGIPVKKGRAEEIKMTRG